MKKIISDCDQIFKHWWFFFIQCKIFRLKQLFSVRTKLLYFDQIFIVPHKKKSSHNNFFTSKKYMYIYKKWVKVAQRCERVTVLFIYMQKYRPDYFFQLNEKGVRSHIKSLRPKKLAPIAYILFRLRLFYSA